MKKTLLILMFCISAIYALPTKDGINNLVEEIKPSRIGASQKDISQIKNPFVITKTTKDKQGNVTTVTSKIRRSYSRSSNRVIRFKLYATLNKSAKINYRWIPLNGKISGYTLKEVTKEHVTLQRGKAKPVKVYLNRKNKNINLLTK